MSLPSFFQRFRRAASHSHPSATDAVSSGSSDVEAARVRARRRLIGMAVLVGAGLIGFPWLFETQPRQMSQDIQVVQAPSGAGASNQAPSVPSGQTGRGVAGRVAVSGIVPAPAAPQAEPADQAGSAARDEPVAKSARVQPQPAPQPEPKLAQVKPVDKTPSKPLPQPAVKGAQKKEPTKDAGKPATRYVVQFGAFADANAAHEARMKVERLGAKTYAQQVDTPGGKRIRVRLGPFLDKAEADRAMATVRKAGLNGALLTL